MLKHSLTAFGISVKTKLIKDSQTQEWLISQCRKKTGMYIDSSVMYKMFTGQRKNAKIQSAICEILDLPIEPTQTRA